MGKCLSVCGNLLFAELPIQCAVEDIGNILHVPRLAVLVPVVQFFCGGLIEEERNEVRDNRQVLELLLWLTSFVVSRFVAVGEWTTIQHLVLSGITTARVNTTVDIFGVQPRELCHGLLGEVDRAHILELWECGSKGLVSFSRCPLCNEIVESTDVLELCCI